jgi:hypothetical protein
MRNASKLMTSVAVALPLVIGGTAPHAADIVETAANAGSFDTLVANGRGGRACRGLEGRGAVHRVRADRRGIRAASRRYGRQPASAREQGAAGRAFDLSRGARQGDVERHRRPGNAGRNRAGFAVSIDATDGALKVEDSSVTQADMETDNGVIHAIDRDHPRDVISRQGRTAPGAAASPCQVHASRAAIATCRALPIG